ncbi:hypothetical protein [Haloarcula laminariae]|uniref:hypothetical protein n=1 Tax=Haloarcula laminariae TaxID=2961577 RepID=UPI0021C5BC63|nr:hypothetical protein [Halomicroarcula laminariae]
MPPTFSARIDEEDIEELKDKAGTEADSEALRSAVEYAVHESGKEQARLVQGLILIVIGASHYVELQVEPAFAPMLIILGLVIFEYPFFRGLFDRVVALAQSL